MVANEKFLNLILVKMKVYNVATRMNSLSGLILKKIAQDGYAIIVELNWAYESIPHGFVMIMSIYIKKMKKILIEFFVFFVSCMKVFF